jgi:MFS family permease
MFLFAGFCTSASDAVIQTLLIDASAQVRTGTLMYSWYQSILNVGASVGGVVFPLAKKTLTWGAFWLWNLIICLGLAVIYVIVAWFVPLVRNDAILVMKPTGQFDGLCGEEKKVENEEILEGDTQKDVPILGQVNDEAK